MIFVWEALVKSWRKKKNTLYVRENNKNMKWKFTVIFLCSCIRRDMTYKDEMVKIWRNVKAYFKLIASVEQEIGERRESGKKIEKEKVRDGWNKFWNWLSSSSVLELTSTMLILNGALYPLNWFAAFARNICGLRKRSRVWD